MSSPVSKEPFFFTSISTDETLVDQGYYYTPWETLIPSPKREIRGIANSRGLIPLALSSRKEIRWPGSTIVTPSKVSSCSPFRINPAFPKTPDQALGPLRCTTNAQKWAASMEYKLPEKLVDKNLYSRAVYHKSELVATRARDLIDDMGKALDIIIKHSPPKRRYRSLSNGDLDDADFACELGIERYREGFGRRAMQSEPSPTKFVIDEVKTERSASTSGKLDVEDLKREIMQELRTEMKKELKAEIEIELKEEIKEEIMDEIVKEHAELQELRQSIEDAEDDRTVQGEDARAVQERVFSADPESIQDIVRGLRDLNDSDGEEENVDNSFVMEEPIDPTDPALAYFLNWKRPTDISSASSSVYSQ